MTAKTLVTPTGKRNPRPQSIKVMVAPIPRPTTGKKGMEPPSARSSGLRPRGRGRIVRNWRAARNRFMMPSQKAAIALIPGQRSRLSCACLRYHRLVKRGHLGEDPDGGLDEIHCQRRPRPLAKAEVEVDQRLLSQELQRDPVPLFHAPVGGDHVLRGRGAERVGDERSRCGYEAVYDNRLLQRGGAQDQPRDPADLEAADLGQDVQSILRVRPVDPQAFFDDADLVCELLIVDPGAVAGYLRCRMAAEGGDDRAARRRVPDPHIPGAEEIDRLRGLPGDIDAGFNGANGLLTAHRRS